MTHTPRRPNLALAPWRVLLLLAAIVLPGTLAAQSLSYPVAWRDSVIDDYHGTRVADAYRWLERPDSRRTAEWLSAERRLTTGYLARTPDREPIRRRLASLWSYARTEVPWREAGRLFYLRNTGRLPQPVLYARNGPSDPSRVVFDPATISPDGSIAVGDYAVSPDGRLLAYRMSRGGADVGDTRVREISSGRDRADVVHGVLGSVCWTHDGRGFFYVRSPAPNAGNATTGSRIAKQLHHHALGQPASRDRLVHEWRDDARWVYCMTSEDGRYLLAVAEKGTASEMHVMELGDPERPDVAAPLVRLLGDSEAFHTPVDIVGRTLYVRTNLDAPRRRVVALDLRDGAGATPRTVVPESPEVIADAVIAGDRIVVRYLANVTSRLRLFALDGRPAGEIALPGVGAVEWPLSGRPSSPELYYAFASFLSPSTVYRYDVRRGASTPFRPPRLPFDASAYETKQIFYTSKDGTRVPMFVTAARRSKRDAPHPTMLTAYGGYGISREPEYEPDVPLWLEMGGIYVVANIRGGGEYGEEWHRAGMLERKQNSFDDFIAAAEYLIAHRYTSPSRLAIYGYSNGGLLIGAAITQRPDLFAAAAANAGHYDMLRYHRFTAGAGWVSEYGSPDDPAAFRYLRAYSPLHNVRTGTCYPATLLLAADHDDRVVPSHSYKFAAALQSAQGCDRPILLRVASDASHSYASRQARIAERSDMWAFIAARLGVRASSRK
ncbi:MAG TPA: prolyl oligopeptidase family serine peptidase [Gemmatimonadaceae bacterium]